jgi:Domain of unknown function (DUF6434)
MTGANMGMPTTFDWHSDRITRETPISKTYRNTQNVRRFLRSQCGADFKFDRPFMQWIRNGRKKDHGRRRR